MNTGREKVSLRRRLWFGVLSLVVATLLSLSVTTFGEDSKSGMSLLPDTDGTYVIEDIKINYMYDKTQYEVVPFVTEPYVVIKGDKKLINLLKWSGKPEFFIDLTGKLPGKYRESVSYSGISKELDVEIYPGLIELRVMEQQTLKMKPVIDLVGVDKIEKDYIVSVPELVQEEVKIRDIQDRLNQVGQVKGIVDVSQMRKTETVTVKLKVYDRDGNELSDINLIDKEVEVKIPIEKKVTVIKEEVVKEIVKEVEVEVVKEVPVPEKQKPVEIKQEGTLSFTNIGPGLEVINKTSDLKWSKDVNINLNNFKAGVYEMTVNDNGERKSVKFEIVSKELPKKDDTDEEN